MQQKVFITKYALTEGVIEGEIIQLFNNMPFVRCKKFHTQYMKKDIDFFFTLEEAQKDAESRRLKKIESLKKQIQKLEKLKF